VYYRKRLSGYCDWKNRIVAPRPHSGKSLYIFLHECGHAHLHDASRCKPRHVEELEAEQWAHQKMREASVPVPRAMTQGAKHYAARMIGKALLRGAKHIDPEARRFAGRFITPSKHRTGA